MICSSILLFLHFNAESSFIQIIKALIEVLYEKFSISQLTFLMSLCNDFSSSRVGSSLFTTNWSPSKNRFQNFFKKRCTPSIPFVSQGLLCSSGPKNISYKRRVSAPYFSTISSGFTTLNIDFDIFSTAHPQIYFPSSKINSAVSNSGLHFLKASISRISLLTMFTSTCIGVVSYSFLRLYDTNVLVSFIL